MDTANLSDAERLLLQMVPEDGTSIGNKALHLQFQIAAGMEDKPIDAGQFETLKQSLLDKGFLVKGKGRGGSIRRAESGKADFDLESQIVQPELPTQPAVKKQQTIPGKQKKAAGKPTIISYRHTDKRRNNPEVGMVSESTDPDDGKDRWCYDPHIDPALQFDFGRAQVEKLIDDSLESGDPDRMRAALEDLKRYSGPYLNWTGKAERTTFDVDTVSLHVHERIDPASKLRITGPFSVEAVPFPSVLSLEKSEQPIEADAAIARYGESLYPRQVFFPMAIPGLPASRAACWSIGTTRTRVNIRSISASWRPSSR